MLRFFSCVLLLMLLPQVCASMVIIGDVNQDGSVDLLDVSPFVDAISSGDYQIEADMNEDGAVDLLDVSKFIDVLSGNAPRIAILKDTLDVQNFESLWAGGGYITQSATNGNVVDGRTFFGYSPIHSGRLHRVTFLFWAGFPANGQPDNDPSRSFLFDLNIGHYKSFAEAEANPTRTDAFFPESTQPQNIFQNPVGMTAEGGPFNLGAAEIYSASYDLSALDLYVEPNQVNYFGVSATSVPTGNDFQLQRSDDSRTVVGTVPDYIRAEFLGGNLRLMNEFFDDAIQNCIRITMIIDE